MALRMRQSRRRVHWICATIAPWALAGGLLATFTASAGYAPVGVTLIGWKKPLTPREIAADNAEPVMTGAIRLASLTSDWPIASRAETIGNLPRSSRLVDELAPSFEMKPDAHDFPVVDRRLKGDPILSLRPSLSRAIPAPLHQDFARAIFSIDEDNLVFGEFRVQPATLSLRENLVAIERFSPGQMQPQAPARPGIETSPEAASSTPAQTTSEGRSGATPSTSREIALASATPAAAGAMPLAIAAAPVWLPGQGGVTAVARSDAAQRYSGLVQPAAMGRELKCLSEAVYFEARSEPEEGQAAVAQVVLNRVKSGLYPQSVCGVVYQNRERYLGCQFTFACEGRSLRITEPEPWRAAQRIAQAVLDGSSYNDEVGGSTHYHARYVRPYWARSLKRMDTIGQHVFYRLRPGQT
ncbi:cell wall hydrolase [Terrarubrum flagellatum]|uniref:cell wall hydrolase n=1 Tax=Terrirubrum flagellatum TaxID=2895980 RepID=UPI00314538DE